MNGLESDNAGGDKLQLTFIRSLKLNIVGFSTTSEGGLFNVPVKYKSKNAFNVVTASNHMKCRSSSCLKVLNMGAWTISIRRLFHEMGRLTQRAAFLRSKPYLRWRNLKPCPRRASSAGDSQNPPLTNQGTWTML